MTYPEIERISLFEILGKVVLNPRETFGYIIAKKSGPEGSIVFLIYALSVFAKYSMLYIVFSQITLTASWLDSFSLSFTKFTIWSTAVSFTALFISAIVSHFFAKSAGGVGEFGEVITLFAFSLVTNATIIIGAGISLILLTPFDLIVITFSAIVYLVWKAFLYMLAVEEVYGVKESDAFGAGVLAPLFLGVFVW